MEQNAEKPSQDEAESLDQLMLENLLYARHVEVKEYADLAQQRGTPIPAMFNQFYKFVQNPSSVSVETFKRMVDTDDTVGSGVDFLTTCLAARLGRYTHPSEQIAQWVNDRLDEIDGGFFNVVKELLGATWAGFAVQEIVWQNTENGWTPKKMVSLPPGTVLFETDRCGEVTEDGILQYQRNYNPALFGTGTSYLFGAGGLGFQNGSGSDRIASRPDAYAKLGDFPFPLRTANTYSYLSIRIPKMKALHYAFDAQAKFGNPYGRSLLRRAYKFWVTKDTILTMMATALDRKGTPLTIVYADPNVTLLDPSKATQGINYKGQKGFGIRADQAARDAFKNIHNDTTIVLPGKKGGTYDTDFVPQAANTGDFIQALDFCNKSIMRALLIPSLVFGNGDGTGSYSLGQEHAKTFDKILDGMNAGLQQVLIQQLIRQMIAYNFPKESWEKEGLGEFSKRELSPDEIQKEMEVIEKAVNIGAVDMNDLADLNQVRDKIRFEPKDKVPEKENIFGDIPVEGDNAFGEVPGEKPGSEQNSNPFGKMDEEKGKAPSFGKEEPKNKPNFFARLFRRG